MKRTILALLIIIGAISLGTISSQATLFLDTWGVSYGNWDPVGAKGQGVDYVNYYTEDWTGNPSEGRVYPGWGGDAYDVEAMYYGLDNSYAYFAVVTGFPLAGRDWGSTHYDPGDIAIDFGNDGKLYRTEYHEHGFGRKPDYEFGKNGKLYRTQSHPEGLNSDPDYEIRD